MTVFWSGEDGIVHDVAEDPTHRRLAFMHMAFLDDRVAASVRILSREGCQEASLGEGARFSWSPDGSRIAYIKMDYHTEIEPIATEISIYDCVTRRETVIKKAEIGSTVGELLYWSKKDGCIYVQTFYPPGVERYIEKYNRWEATGLRSVDFSGDEEYLYRTDLELPWCSVWKTREANSEDGIPLFVINKRNNCSFRWLSGHLLCFATGIKAPEYIIDVSTREMWTVDGWILAVLEGNCVLWKTPSGEFKRTALSELQQASLEEILACEEDPS